jgi:hypothetical protein
MSTVDVVIAVAPWVFVASRIKVAWIFTVDRIKGVRREGAGWPAFSTWLFALFLGIGLTFRLVPLRVAFDNWIGMPNLGWLLSFIAESVAVYVAACGCRAIPRLPIPRWLHIYMASTLLIFVVIFVTNLATGYERSEYTTAGTPFELVFMSTKYICLAIMTFFIGTAFVRLYRGEQNKLTRLRLALLAGSALMGVVYGSARTTFVLLAYFYPACPVLGILRVLEKGSQVVLALMWPLATMLSSKVHLFMRPFERFQKSMMLRDLRTIQSELSDLDLLAMWDGRSRSHRGSLDFQIYRALISILDGKRLLLAQLKAVEDGEDESRSDANPERTRVLPSRGENWDGAAAEKARLLQQLFGGVGNDLEYFDLLAAYRNVGRALRSAKMSPIAN